MDSGMSQKTAAAMLGVPPSVLNRIELERPGARELRAGEVAQAAHLYNCSADWLLGLSQRLELRPDLADRLQRLPQSLVRPVIEEVIYALVDHLEDGVLKGKPTRSSE